MSELWLPPASPTPPQVSEDAEGLVAAQLLEEGVVAVGKSALEQLQEREEELGVYLDQLGFDLNQRSAEGYWPERVLKIGAGLGWQAYRETGFFQGIGDTFSTAEVQARLAGVPSAYFTSLVCDPTLQRLMDTAIEAPDFKAPINGGFKQALDMGAGCVRFYMERALAAA